MSDPKGFSRHLGLITASALLCGGLAIAAPAYAATGHCAGGHSATHNTSHGGGTLGSKACHNGTKPLSSMMHHKSMKHHMVRHKTSHAHSVSHGGGMANHTPKTNSEGVSSSK